MTKIAGTTACRSAESSQSEAVARRKKAERAKILLVARLTAANRSGKRTGIDAASAAEDGPISHNSSTAKIAAGKACTYSSKRGGKSIGQEGDRADVSFEKTRMETERELQFAKAALQESVAHVSDTRGTSAVALEAAITEINC